MSIIFALEYIRCWCCSSGKPYILTQLLAVSVFLCLVSGCSSFHHASLSGGSKGFDNNTKTCEAFFNAYVESAGNFTHCELIHAKPFRICTECVEPYAIMKALYADLTTDPKLHDCMLKYLKSDRVQIIPTMQKNADDLWETSDCDGCVSHLHVDEKTNDVTYTVPPDTDMFLFLYDNITACLQVDMLVDFQVDVNPPKDNNISVLCHLCNGSYHKLNSHYDSMADNSEGNVCMDIVDMMNYTRVTWSESLNCSHRSGDVWSVVAITLVVAVFPLFFYLPLRYTSKETIMRVLIQKRLGRNREGILSSATHSFAAGDNQGRRSTPLPPIAS